MSSHCVTKRISTRKSQIEAQKLMCFLNKIIDSNSSKILSKTLESKGNNIILDESQPKEKNYTYSDYMNEFKQNIENGQITNFENLKANLLSFYTEIFPKPPNQDVEVCWTDLITMIQQSIFEKSLEIRNFEHKVETSRVKKDKDELIDSSKNSKSSKKSTKKKTISKKKNLKNPISLKDSISKLKKRAPLSSPFIEAEILKAKEIEARAQLFCDLNTLIKDQVLQFFDFIEQNNKTLINKEIVENDIVEDKLSKYIINIETIENINKISECLKTFKQTVLQDKGKK